MDKLENKDLFISKCYINGEWIIADDKSTEDIFNPATGECIGSVPNCGAAETKRAIEAAQVAFKSWKKLTAKERGAYLIKWFDLIEANKQTLARILTLEQGKPLAESVAEIGIGASYFPWYAEEAKRAYGRVIPQPRANVRPITHMAPVGVVFAITPWNFPSSLITRKVAPALAAGCTMVIKAPAYTPYSAFALVKLAEEAGIPKGVVNVISGDAVAIGKEACANPIVRKISFTGSTPVGKTLMAQSAVTMKRLSMELGGNAPFIIFDDANLKHTIPAAVGCKFRNAGQTCICANRFLVQKGIVDDFIKAYSEQINAFKVGNGLEEGVTIGPMINEQAVSKVEALIEDAVSKGAKILIGGKRHALGGLFYEPTLLTGLTKEMRIFREEIFGPVAAIMTFETEAEAIAIANDCQVGLAAYVMTNDMARSWRMSEELEFGMVGINDAILAMTEVPFGGIKESGMGKEGAPEGLMDYMETRYALFGGVESL